MSQQQNSKIVLCFKCLLHHSGGVFSSGIVLLCVCVWIVKSPLFKCIFKKITFVVIKINVKCRQSISQSNKNCTHLSIHLHFAPHAIRYISSHNRKLEKSLFLFISRYCSNNWFFFIHDSWEHLSHILIIRTAFIFIKFDFVFFYNQLSLVPFVYVPFIIYFHVFNLFLVIRFSLLIFIDENFLNFFFLSIRQNVRFCHFKILHRKMFAFFGLRFKNTLLNWLCKTKETKKRSFVFLFV